MSEETIRIRGRKIIVPDGVVEGTIVVRDGTFAAIDPYGSEVEVECDAGDAVIMPGVVDVHVHVNEPGRSEWEGFEHASRAAAAGGVTTIVDMPLNAIPPTTSIDALQAKAESAAGTCRVDYGFWGGLVPGNLGQLRPLVEAGALGFKCFLADSGVDEFPRVDEEQMTAGMKSLANTGAPLLVHAESQPALDEALEESGLAAAPREYRAYLASRPARVEAGAVSTVVRACMRTRARAHIVHVSSASVFPQIREAKRAGLPLTAETCPHYLLFTSERIGDGETLYKCAPPIRDRENREGLWEGLRSGIVDLIASDHSPSPAELKWLEYGDFRAAWGGINGIQLALAAVWTEASQRGFAPEDLAPWLCEAPARLAGIADRKGAIEVGLDADLTIWDPDAFLHVERDTLHSRHPRTAYEGHRLRGVVRQTFVRGQRVFDAGSFGSKGTGRWVRGRAEAS